MPIRKTSQEQKQEIKEAFDLFDGRWKECSSTGAVAFSLPPSLPKFNVEKLTIDLTQGIRGKSEIEIFLKYV